MRKSKFQNRGITLIETVLYVALFAVFLSVAVPFLFEVTSAQDITRSQANIFRDQLFLRGQIRNFARRFDLVEPGLNATSSELIFRKNGSGTFTVQPNDFFSTSTQFSGATFMRKDLMADVPGAHFEVLEMNISFQNKNFGTTTFVLKE